MFCCAAPRFVANSNGVRILYRLTEYLTECGYKSRIVAYDENLAYSGGVEEVAPTILVDPSEIAIYSDSVSGNPFGARQVVRFLGNRPYYLNGRGISYGSSDYVSAYSRAMDADLPQLFLLEDERPLMKQFRRLAKESQVCLYYGKIGGDVEAKTLAVREHLSDFDRIHVITRLVPGRRQKLLELLARSALLISFDPLSNINYEATVLGTPVILMDNAYEISKNDFNIPLWGLGFSMSEYPELQSEVHQAFDVYEAHVSGQREMVALWASEVVDHFRRIQTQNDTEYCRRHRELMENRAKIDRDRYERFNGGTPLVNIGLPTDLPIGVLRALSFERQLRAKRVIEGLSLGRQARLRRLVSSALARIGLFSIVREIWHVTRAVLLVMTGVGRTRYISKGSKG